MLHSKIMIICDLKSWFAICVFLFVKKPNMNQFFLFKLCFSNKLRCGLISQSYFFVFVLVKGGEFHLDFWILLVPKMVISKLSGNTVRSTHLRLQKAFWYIWLFTENWIQLTQNLTLELYYLQFDAKIDQIGNSWSLKLHKEV